MMLLLMVILLSLGVGTDMLKILVIPLQMRSHMIYLNAAAEGLLENGHEVYTIQHSQMPEPKNLIKKGFKVLTFNKPEGDMTHDSEKFQQILMADVFGEVPSPIDTFNLRIEMAKRDCELMLEDKFISDMRRIGFDIAIVDGFPVAPFSFLIPHVLGLPYVYVSSLANIGVIRVPLLPSFVPGLIQEASDVMSFGERLANFLSIVLFESGILYPFPELKNFTLIEKYRQNTDVKTWDDLSARSLLFFITRGPILEWPAPTMPNYFALDGMTASLAQPLPSELEQVIEDATDGIIVVSFGSVASLLPQSIVKQFLEAFSKRKEFVLWRLSDMNDQLYIPSNVKLLSWLPQNDILGHPKTKLFITHCGNNGQYEAVYHGIPMIGFPLFAEQHHNGFRMASHNFGIVADLKTITAAQLEENMNEVIGNIEYSKSVKKASAILKSLPMSSKETVAFWVEHVMEHGADHLCSYAMDMPLYQYLMLDILGFISLLLILLLCLCNIMIKQVCKRMCHGTEKVKSE